MKSYYVLLLALVLSGCSIGGGVNQGRDSQPEQSTAFLGDDWDTDSEQPGFFTGKKGAISLTVEDGVVKVNDDE